MRQVSQTNQLATLQTTLMAEFLLIIFFFLLFLFLFFSILSFSGVEHYLVSFSNISSLCWCWGWGSGGRQQGNNDLCLLCPKVKCYFPFRVVFPTLCIFFNVLVMPSKLRELLLEVILSDINAYEVEFIPRHLKLAFHKLVGVLGAVSYCPVYAGPAANEMTGHLCIWSHSNLHTWLICKAPVVINQLTFTTK